MTDITLMAEQWGCKGKVLVCGNGGLAAESEHFVAELMGKFGRDVYVPAVALTSNTSLLSALANDMGWEDVFAHQVRVLAGPDDLVIGMTTSASKNVLRAAMVAHDLGASVLLVPGGAMHGETVAEKQEWMAKQLHELALALKERYARRQSE